MLLVLDNYDSFTYNLVQYVGELGAEPQVFRNDVLSTDEALELAPVAIIISPGPGTPSQAGISIPLIRAAAGQVPVLGVCLGHQAIAEAFGGRVVRAGRLMHGKTTDIVHRDETLFSGVANPLRVMRYHSLVATPDDFPTDLEITAWSGDRAEGEEIMALRHRRYPIYGVQFHPESIATVDGKRILKNFLDLAVSQPKPTCGKGT